MTILRGAKWTLITLTLGATLLLFSNFATAGILLIALDIFLSFFYAVIKSRCDRRQMHKMPLLHN